MIHLDVNFINPMMINDLVFKTQLNFIEKHFSDLDSFLFSA